MIKLLNLMLANKGRGDQPKAQANGDEVTLYIYDMIGWDFWSDSGIIASDFVKELAGIEASTIHLRINSPGGYITDARAIQTALMQHPAKVITHIDGYAASAASFIALAGDEIEIAEGGFFMIHKAWTCMCGNSDDMLAEAEVLEKFDSTLVNDYQKKSGQSEKQILEWMKAETWFTGQEALEAGFVDRVYEGKQAENRFDLSAYNNAPKSLLEMEETKTSNEPENTEADDTPDRLEPEARKEEDAIAEHRQHLERRLALIDIKAA